MVVPRRLKAQEHLHWALPHSKPAEWEQLPNGKNQNNYLKVEQEHKNRTIPPHTKLSLEIGEQFETSSRKEKEFFERKTENNENVLNFWKKLKVRTNILNLPKERKNLET